MNQCKRLKGSDRARQFCCKKITAGMNAAGWPLPVFCERLADSTRLGADLKKWRKREFVPGQISVFLLRL